MFTSLFAGKKVTIVSTLMLLLCQLLTMTKTTKLELYSDGYHQRTSGYSRRMCLAKDNLVLANGFFKDRTSLNGQGGKGIRFGVLESVSHDL